MALMAMRLQVAQSAGQTGERYLALTLLHGSLMVFFVLTAAPQFGFGYYFMPLQIGANDMALPRLSGLSFWLTLVSLAGVASSFFLPIHAGMELWLFSIVLFSFGAILTSINFCTTVTDLRTEGMSLARLPLTVWAWYVTAVLSLLFLQSCSRHAFFSDAFATVLRCARHFFRPFTCGAMAALVLVLCPGRGLRGDVALFRHRLPFGGDILSPAGVGRTRSGAGFVRGRCLRILHLGVPHVLQRAKSLFSTGIFAAGLLAGHSRFASAGKLAGHNVGRKNPFDDGDALQLGCFLCFCPVACQGLFLARHDVAAALVTDDFVTGHFHLVMGVAATFAILGALFFWFPRLYGRCLNETLGKVHFWITFAGVYCIFMPMHWLGLLDRMRSSGMVVAHFPALSAARSFITSAMIVTIAAQVIFT
jgi:cytochrome c oxidase subunit 1